MIASTLINTAASAYDLYTDKTINPSTFSGAIDIVVVRHENRPDLIEEQRLGLDNINSPNSLAKESNNDESKTESKNESKNECSKESKEKELKQESKDESKEAKSKDFYISTPFHVRFGKFAALRPLNVPVCIKVNGEINYDVAMKLNSKGIAQFVDAKSVDLSFMTASKNIETKAAQTPKAEITSTTTTTVETETKTTSTTTSYDANKNQIDKNDNLKAPRVRKRDRLYNYLFGSSNEDATKNDNSDDAMTAAAVTSDAPKNGNDVNSESGTVTTITESKMEATGDTIIETEKVRIRKRDRLMAFVKSSVKSGMSYYYSENENENDTIETNSNKNNGDNVEIIASSPMSAMSAMSSSSSLSSLSDLHSLYESPVNNVPPSNVLEKLKLKEGLNKIEFIIPKVDNNNKNDKNDKKDKIVLRSNECNIFLWRNDLKIVISDVDGTITRADVSGHFMSTIGYDWMHPGVIELFNKIYKNGYQIVYLSARGIGQADTTRHYLFEMCSQQIDNDICKFPKGPVLLSPTTTRQALYREVIQKRPQDFKIPTLLHLFYALTLQETSETSDEINEIDNNNGDKNDKNESNDEKSNETSNKESCSNVPFFAGFGNRVTDVASYDGVNIDHKNIYIITNEYKKLEKNAKTKVWLDKANYVTKYEEILPKVDQLFPRVK